MFLIFREMELSTPKSKNLLIFKKEKKQNLLYFSEKSYENFFPKLLLSNSFHLFYELNQTILPVYKTIFSF